MAAPFLRDTRRLTDAALAIVILAIQFSWPRGIVLILCVAHAAGRAGLWTTSRPGD